MWNAYNYSGESNQLMQNGSSSVPENMYPFHMPGSVSNPQQIYSGNHDIYQNPQSHFASEYNDSHVYNFIEKEALPSILFDPTGAPLFLSNDSTSPHLSHDDISKLRKQKNFVQNKYVKKKQNKITTASSANGNEPASANFSIENEAASANFSTGNEPVNENFSVANDLVQLKNFTAREESFFVRSGLDVPIQSNTNLSPEKKSENFDSKLEPGNFETVDTYKANSQFQDPEMLNFKNSSSQKDSTTASIPSESEILRKKEKTRKKYEKKKRHAQRVMAETHLIAENQTTKPMLVSQSGLENKECDMPPQDISMPSHVNAESNEEKIPLSDSEFPDDVYDLIFETEKRQHRFPANQMETQTKNAMRSNLVDRAFTEDWKPIIKSEPIEIEPLPKNASLSQILDYLK